MNENRPDYELCLVTKSTNIHTGKRTYTRVGAGWDVFDGGTISIKLRPGTVLDWRLNDEFYINVTKLRDEVRPNLEPERNDPYDENIPPA